MNTLWSIPESADAISSMVSLSNETVALGYSNGDILITTLARILQTNKNDWTKDPIVTLKGHEASISSLFVPQFENSNRRNILLSGDSTGFTFIWDYS